MTRPATSPLFATDATLTGGPQVGLSTRLDPGAGVRAQGFYFTHQLPARAFGFLLGIVGDWIGYHDELLARSAMQTWRREILGGAGTDTYYFLLGIDQGFKDKATVGLGKNLSASLYIRGQSGGFEPAETTTGVSPLCAAAPAGTSAWQIAVAPNGWARYTAMGGANSVVSTGASTFCAMHYAPGSATPFIQAFTTAFGKNATFGGSTGTTGPTGLTALTAAITGTPGGEFADDGGNNVAFAGSSTISGVTRYRVLSSVDGGSTWTAALTLAAGALYLNVAWSSTLGLFVAVYEETAGVVKVSTSPTGAGSWTLASTTTFTAGLSTSVSSMAVVGRCIAKLTGGGLAYSLDLGATWRFVFLDMTNDIRRIFAINKRLCAIASDGIIYTSGVLETSGQDLP